VGSFEVPLLGAYNVRNALAAIAVGAAVGLSTDTMAAGLRAFKGVRRRMQLRGTADGVAVYDDFAHHPTAIAETLAGVRSAYPDRRVWAIFEPRSATSCRRVFQAEFARAFAAADRILLPDIFRSSLPEDQRLSVDHLISDLKTAGKDARFIPRVDDIVATVAKEAGNGDLVIVMSNGGFDNIHQKLLSALEARPH
jgi:UDP-N-acetylmuramate: L-alanyl-gamma-D-glutamyl-meso-diaminopimelate ligase